MKARLIKVHNLPPGGMLNIHNGDLYLVEDMRGEQARIMEGPNKGLTLPCKYTMLVPEKPYEPPAHGKPRIVKIRKAKAA